MTEQTDIEVKAKELGWSPKEEFRGDPEQWIDAETYVKRGETLMPLIKANNQRLSKEIGAVRQELAKAREELTASKDAIEALKDFNSAANRKAMQESVAVTRAALIQAKKEGDPEVEVTLTEQLAKETAALREAEESSKEEGLKKKEPEKKANGAAEEEDYTKTAEWRAWVDENSWFGSDKRRTALSMAIADEIRTNPETSAIRGRAFLDKVSEEVEAVFSSSPRSKVEGGGRSSASSDNRGVKSYSELPQEAKDACENLAGRLVGKGRAFASKEDWRKHYAKTYFEET